MLPRVKFMEDIPDTDYKTKIESFLDGCVYELADTQTYDKIATKKFEFLQWLKSVNLLVELQNFELVEPMTEFQWKCRQDLLSILYRFDSLMIQCVRNNDGLNKFDEYLRKRMVEFSKDYDQI